MNRDLQERVFPVPDALAARGIPFLFTSGYGEDAVRSRYPDAVNCCKPLDMQALLRAIDRACVSAVDKRAQTIESCIPTPD